MMAKMTVTGLDEFSTKIYAIENGALKAVHKALYAGADVLADSLRESITALPAISDYEAMGNYKKGTIGQITYKQRDGLLNSMGIAPHKDTGGAAETKIGFDGYNEVITKRWPNGQPNAMIARSVESGTSFMRKTPFVASAVRRSKERAQNAMSKAFDEEINKLGG